MMTQVTREDRLTKGHGPTTEGSMTRKFNQNNQVFPVKGKRKTPLCLTTINIRDL